MEIIKSQEKGRQAIRELHSIDLVAYTQILPKQKQLNGRNHHIPFNVNVEY
jgi:hypothetical protein